MHEYVQRGSLVEYRTIIQYNAIQCTVQRISQMPSAASSQHLDAVIDFTFINLSIHLFQHFLEEILLGKEGK